MKGVLIGNLGTPSGPDTTSVKKYLKEFLSDPFVINIPQPFRWVLVNLIIVPFRSKNSAEAYKSIWRKEGSPLLYYSKKQTEELQKKMNCPVELCMNYGKPSVQEALRKLSDSGAKKIFFMPLYPHYALSSFESIVQKVKKEIKYFSNMRLEICPPFYEAASYIDALSEKIRKELPKKYDHILFSYHGIPEKHILKADPTRKYCLKVKDCCHRISDIHRSCYRAQVFRTTELITSRLKISEAKHSVSFQSRLGRIPWLKPFTDVVISDLPKKKVRHLVVVCPSFVSDCLETLEEIGIRGKAIFLKNGGKKLTLISCLNDGSSWIKSMKKIIEQKF